MKISFKTNKLRKTCNQKDLARRTYGEIQGKLLMRRLDDLQAAECLDDMRFLPQARCHELKGRKKGQLSVDLKHSYRFIFEPADKPIPKKPDGGLDWRNVKSIRILGVEDTHD